MRFQFLCPACQRPVALDVSPSTAKIECPCGWHRDLQAIDWNGGAPSRCLACGNDDLWRQKDFPQAAGLLAIAVQVVVSTWFWFRREPGWTYATLMTFAVLDMVLFIVMPDVLVCYRCRARHRTAAGREQHRSFDHERAERYRQERLKTGS
jgi:hypothetical protein